MKKFIAVFCLLLCAATLQAKDKPNPADFPIKIHISGSHIEPYSGGTYLHVDTNLNGKKIELTGAAVTYKRIDMLLIPGDYPAKLLNDSQNPNSAWLGQDYELLLPDGTTWHCSISGISE
jgi:hypothetical protein